jgi:peroxiredoxin
VSDSGPERVKTPAPDPDPAEAPPTGAADHLKGPLNTRRYTRFVGVIAVALVIAFAIYALTSKGVGATGVPPGQPLHYFAAPLAASTLNGDANLSPPCTLARHDPRALNICLIAQRSPLVVGFFVTNSSDCKREVDTMQSLARERAYRGVQFAAVAIHASHTATAKVVRAQGWTIPVAYDADGAVGAVYGVTACPFLELANRGGTVAARLVGNHWLNRSALASQVQSLLRR